MEYNVTLKTLPERYVASVRRILPSYDCEGTLWGVLMRETAGMHLVDGDPCYCGATYHDAEYKEVDVDVEVQRTLRGRYPDTEHVRFKTVPPVTFASATYQGGYHKLRDVSAAVAAWVRDNGYAFDGPSFFIYHVSPNETKNPDEFVTEVCFPVKKA